MALLDIFKKKKKTPEKKAEKKGEFFKPIEKEVKAVKATEDTKATKTTGSVKKEGIRRKDTGLASRIILSPHITEKATILNEQDKYIFKIKPRANKTEVKKALEGLYGVDVEKVRIIKVPRKKRRIGRISGWKKGYKKALVKIKKGQKIEILPR